MSPSGRYVLRRKPPGKLLPSAHAVDREYRVITALGPTGVPVPKTYCLCTDESVIGTMFYVMEDVEGRVLWDPQLPGMTPGERRAIFAEMNRVIAHDVLFTIANETATFPRSAFEERFASQHATIQRLLLRKILPVR